MDDNIKELNRQPSKEKINPSVQREVGRSHTDQGMTEVLNQLGPERDVDEVREDINQEAGNFGTSTEIKPSSPVPTVNIEHGVYTSQSSNLLDKSMTRRKVVEAGAAGGLGVFLGGILGWINLKKSKPTVPVSQSTIDNSEAQVNTIKIVDAPVNSQDVNVQTENPGTQNQTETQEQNSDDRIGTLVDSFIVGYTPDERQQLIQMVKDEENIYTSLGDFERRKQNTLRWIDDPQNGINVVVEQFKEKGVIIIEEIVKLLPAFIFVESGGEVKADSLANAAGLCQFIPGTARETATQLPEGFIQEDLSAMSNTDVIAFLDNHPKESIMLALRYLQNLSNQFKNINDGKLLAIQAYNMGSGNIENISQQYTSPTGEHSSPNFIEMIDSSAFKNAGLLPQTKDYTPQILAAKDLLSQ